MKASALIERLRELRQRFGENVEVAFKGWVDPSIVLDHAKPMGEKLTDQQACEVCEIVADYYTDEDVNCEGVAPIVRDAIDDHGITTEDYR